MIGEFENIVDDIAVNDYEPREKIPYIDRIDPGFLPKISTHKKKALPIPADRFAEYCAKTYPIIKVGDTSWAGLDANGNRYYKNDDRLSRALLTTLRANLLANDKIGEVSSFYTKVAIELERFVAYADRTQLNSDHSVLPINHSNTYLDCREGRIKETLPVLYDHKHNQIVGSINIAGLPLIRPSQITQDQPEKLPLYQEILLPILKTADSINYFLDLLLTGLASNGTKPIVFIYGAGGSGKTTLAEVIKHGLGPQLTKTVIASHFWKGTHVSDAHTGAIAHTIGCRILLPGGSELIKNRPLDEGRLKAYTGDGVFPMSNKGADPEEVFFKAMIVFTSNPEPRLSTDTGMRRRIHVIRTDTPLGKLKKDPNFIRGVIEEHSSELISLIYQRLRFHIDRGKNIDDIQPPTRHEAQKDQLFSYNNEFFIAEIIPIYGALIREVSVSTIGDIKDPFELADALLLVKEVPQIRIHDIVTRYKANKEGGITSARVASLFQDNDYQVITGAKNYKTIVATPGNHIDKPTITKKRTANTNQAKIDLKSPATNNKIDITDCPF